MDEERAWTVLAHERRAFADVIDGFSDAQWDTQSLCASWTVAEVATHLMVGSTGTMGSFLTAMVRARGRFARANEVMVERKMNRPRAAIVTDLRDQADNRFHPPGMGWQAPLSDFFVHRLDALVPLGLAHGRSLDAWGPVLDFVVSPAARRGFTGPGLPELTYVATDLGWSHGAGPRVEAPVESLALAITRRPSALLGDLDGPGADALRAWAFSAP